MLELAKIRPDDTVVAVGIGSNLLATGVLAHLGPDGSVVAVEGFVDSLEELRTACDDPRLSYLVGTADVLPLPDASADVVVADLELGSTDVAGELFRVLRTGGRVAVLALAEPERVGAILTSAGFSDVVFNAGGGVAAGTKP